VRFAAADPSTFGDFQFREDSEMRGLLTQCSWIGLFTAGALSCVTATAAEPTAGSPTFAEALRAAGWQVDVQVDGSLILRPGDTPAAAATSSMPSDATAAPKSAGFEVLRDYGWGVKTDADGATLLFPPGAASTVAPVTAPAADIAEARPARAEMARNLDTLLAERGWRAERDADGSLLLFPLRRASPQAQPVAQALVQTAPTATTAVAAEHTDTQASASAKRSSGFIPALVTNGQVQLPVDHWKEARAVAQSWLTAVNDPTLTLGKMRKVLNVYLVSVVDSFRRTVLRHQIAISADDGRVIVVY
jgi:hypothetical protein